MKCIYLLLFTLLISLGFSNFSYADDYYQKQWQEAQDAAAKNTLDGLADQDQTNTSTAPPTQTAPQTQTIPSNQPANQPVVQPRAPAEQTQPQNPWVQHDTWSDEAKGNNPWANAPPPPPPQQSNTQTNNNAAQQPARPAAPNIFMPAQPANNNTR